MGSMPWKASLMDRWEDEFAGRRVEVVRPGTVYDGLGRPKRPKPDRLEGQFVGQGTYKWRPVVFVNDGEADLSIAVERGMGVRAIDEPVQGLGWAELAVYGAVVRLSARLPRRARGEVTFDAYSITREMVRAGVVPPLPTERMDLALRDLVAGGRLQIVAGEDVEWRLARGDELLPMFPRCPNCWSRTTAAHAQAIHTEPVGGFCRTSKPSGLVTYECQRGHFHNGVVEVGGLPDDILVRGVLGAD